MEVSLHANMCDRNTTKVADALDAPFETIGKALSRNYGGIMEHLWIDFELIPGHAKLRSPWSFRFQRKVSGRDRLTGLTMPACYNVGHYSVRPDFRALAHMPLESAVNYALTLIYSSTSLLIEKEKKLGGFDADAFRADFLSVCTELGYSIEPNNTCQQSPAGDIANRAAPEE
jgi:hypothetical protein